MRRRCFVVYVNLGDAPAGEALAINLVIDDSGSMSGEKIAAVRGAFAELVRALPDTCQLGLVSFGSSVRLFCRPTEHREFLLDQLENFAGGSGGTALFDAVAEACQGFEAASRQRYVLALTDGGECASEKIKSVDELVEIALANNVKVYCLGFGGDVDRDQLQAIASRTGGEFFGAADVEDLGHRLQQALAGILVDRKRVLLRPEVTALLGESLGQVPPWWSQLSIDEWNEASVWKDNTHIRYPRQPVGDLAQAGAFAAIRDGLSEMLEHEIERPAHDRVRGFDDDADLFVVGWLHDPAFRAISLKVVDLFRETQARLAAGLPGDAYPILVPLVRRLASQSVDARTCMAAWLVAAHTAALRRPLTVLELDDSNHHRARNPHGYLGLSESDQLIQAAALLRALAFDPDATRQLASESAGSSGAMAVASGGAVSLVKPRLQFGLRSAAVSLLRQAVTTFTTAPARAVVDTDLAKRTLTAADLEPDRLRGRLLGPSDRAPEGSQLAEMQISLQDFWPPPPGVAEGDYLARLPREIEEKGTYKIARRLSMLLRLLDQRTRTLTDGARERVDQVIDGLIVGESSQGSEVTLKFLEQCHQVVVDWQHALGPELAGPMGGDLDRLLLFTPEETGFRGSGAPSFEQAMDRLVKEVENRPSGVAFFLRHALLSVALGALAHQVAPWVTGSGPTPIWLSPAVALSVGAISVVRWWHVRQRLVRAIKETCSALSRSAWELAKDHTLAAMRSLLERMRAWIGNPREPVEASAPAWIFDPTRAKPRRWLAGEGFDETTATRHQLVDGLKTFLRQSAEALEATTTRETANNNAFVWELGSSVVNPTGSPPKLSLPAPVATGAQRWEWRDLASRDIASRWREIVRRHYCDNLDKFLTHHQERLELPGRLLFAAMERLTAEQAVGASVPTALGTLSPVERERVLVAMRASGYPALFSEVVGDRAASSPNWRVLVSSQDLSAASTIAPEAVAIEPAGELHLLSTLRARIEASHTWSACGTAWRATGGDERAALLEAHGSAVGGWADPWHLEPESTGSAGEALPPGSPSSEVDV